MKQRKRERLVQAHWEKRSALRKAVVNMNLPREERLAASIALNKMKRDTSPSRLRNRCQLTGRPRAFIRKFQMSRICFRELASMGMIPGVIKASW